MRASGGAASSLSVTVVHHHPYPTTDERAVDRLSSPESSSSPLDGSEDSDERSQAHRGEVFCVASAGPEGLIVSGGADGYVRADETDRSAAIDGAEG